MLDHTIVQSQVSVGSVNLYSSVQLGTQKYSSSEQIVYSITVYLYMKKVFNSVKLLLFSKTDGLRVKGGG